MTGRRVAAIAAVVACLVVGGMPAVAAERDVESAAITWVDCPAYLPDDVECGRLDVPIDWALPDDPRRASIALRTITTPVTD